MSRILLKERDVRAMIVAMRDKAGGVRSLARDLDLSPSYVSDLCNGRRKPCGAILAKLGMKRVERYVAIKNEEERTDAPCSP